MGETVVIDDVTLLDGTGAAAVVGLSSTTPSTGLVPTDGECPPTST